MPAPIKARPQIEKNRQKKRLSPLLYAAVHEDLMYQMAQRIC